MNTDIISKADMRGFIQIQQMNGNIKLGSANDQFYTELNAFVNRRIDAVMNAEPPLAMSAIFEGKHHNTTNLEDQKLQDAEQKAKFQTVAIVNFFSMKSSHEFTPCQVWQLLMDYGRIDKSTPVTSIRRSITDLTTEGYLIRTTNKIKGHFGRDVYTWRWRRTSSILGNQTAMKL